MTGLNNSIVFQKTGWLITYRIIKWSTIWKNKWTTNSPSNHPAPPLSRSNFLLYWIVSLSLDCWTSSNPPASRTCEGWANSSPGCLVSHCVCHCVTFMAHPRAAGKAGKANLSPCPPCPPRGHELQGRTQPQELPVTGAWYICHFLFQGSFADEKKTWVPKALHLAPLMSTK